MYTDVALDSLTIDIDPISVYDCNHVVRVTINCDRAPTAREIRLHDKLLEDVMEILKLSSIAIKFRGRHFREYANPSFTAQFDRNVETKVRIDMSNIDIGIDLNSLYNSSNPVYLIDLNTEVLLFTNPVACSEHQKTANEFLGENFSALSYPDELETRKRLLRLDGKLTNYEFKGLSWYKDGDIWRRKEVNFVTDFQKIEFFGRECRLGIDLMSEETQRFVD